MEPSSQHEHSHLKMLPALPHTKHPASRSMSRHTITGCAQQPGTCTYCTQEHGEADPGAFQRDPMQADMLGHSEAEQAGTHAPQHSAHAGNTPAGMQLHTNHPKMCPERHMHRQKA